MSSPTGSPTGSPQAASTPPLATAGRAACPAAPATRGPTVRDGNLVFRATRVQGPIPFIIGTHAQFDPKGTFVRVRLSAQNPDSVFHTLVPEDQRLVDASGRLYEPSVDAMRIKRQPISLDLGAGNVLEFDVWFDVASVAAAHGIRVNDAKSGGCGRVLLLPPPRP